jgi:CheY-like chemotaxis protein
MRSTRAILLVEDDNADVLIIKRALKELEINNELVTTNNGEEALEYLQSDKNKKPCIILLDLNMPKMNGIEFLKIVKNDDNFKDIPIVALTTSQNSSDITQCFKHGIAGYVVKPIDYKKFVKALRIMDLYWMLSEMPNEPIGDWAAERINIADLDGKFVL